MADIYHVQLQDGYWKVLKDGAKRAIRRFDLRQEAIDYAQDVAKKKAPAQLVIHRDDSPIRMRFTYGAIT